MIPGTTIITNLRDRFFARLASRHKIGLLSVGWSTGAHFVGLFVRLFSNLVLTRLLAPEAYGIIGSALAVMTTLEWLSDMGVEPSLIRHPKGDTREFLITGWWVALGRGFVLALIAVTLAWPWAEFCRQPELLAILLVMSVRPLLFGLRSPGTPMLRRNMQYKRLFADEVIVTVAGTAMSITLGILTGSVWAIVLGMLFGDIIDLALSYILVPVQPRFEFSREAFEAIRGLGVQVFFNTLLMAVWLNLDRLIGLRFVDAALMGLYAIAWNLSSIVEALITRWTQVHFAMLSREEDLEERDRWHELVYNRVARLLIPPVSLGIVGAPLVIQILYDPRYVGAGILLSILTARLMIRSLGQIQFQYLLVGARVKLATWSYLVAMVIQAAIFYPMVTYFGIIGLASCILISTTVLTIVQTAFIYRTNLHGYLPVAATLVWIAAGLACTQPFVQFVNRFITF